MKLRQGPPGGATVEHVPTPPPCPKCPGVSPHGLRFCVEWFDARGNLRAFQLVCELRLIAALDNEAP